jgi:DNA polymerase-4
VGATLDIEMPREIVHVDMDAFYASVEQRDHPELRGKPVLVGGPSARGVVAAASYEARKFGARSAMPMAEALRRCPQAIVVSGRHGHYSEVSAQVFAIFRRYTPLVEGLSLDEAFLDVTASASLFGDGATIAKKIKEQIKGETELTASAGVAPNKFVAKIASDLRKPDGLVVVKEEEIRAFLDPLPIERMWGIGPKTAISVRAAGLETLGDLARARPATLERIFGRHAESTRSLAMGEDEREVSPDREALSIGAEETFEKDLGRREDLLRYLLSQSSRVAERLFSEGLAAGGLTVKVKYADFTLKTRAMKLFEPVNDTDAIYAAAKELLERFELGHKRVRLTGVSATHLVPHDGAPVLFPDPKNVRGKKIEAATQALRERFGRKTLTRAALLGMDEREGPQPGGKPKKG